MKKKEKKKKKMKYNWKRMEDYFVQLLDDNDATACQDHVKWSQFTYMASSDILRVTYQIFIKRRFDQLNPSI